MRTIKNLLEGLTGLERLIVILMMVIILAAPFALWERVRSDKELLKTKTAAITARANEFDQMMQECRRDHPLYECKGLLSRYDPRTPPERVVSNCNSYGAVADMYAVGKLGGVWK